MRLLVASIATVVVISVLAGSEPTDENTIAGGTVVGGTGAGERATVVVQDDHRVLSMPIDERVPQLEPGDEIDLYLGTDSSARADDTVVPLDEPGIVTSVRESSFSVAVPEHSVARIAAALRNGGVLVVRR